MKKIIPILVLVVVFSSCEKLLFDFPSKTNAEGIFDAYWNILNDKYSFFKLKNVDWDKVYDDYKALISNDMSDDALFNTLGSMTMLLKDGHTSLEDVDNGQKYSYDGYYTNFQRNYDWDVVRSLYLQNDWNFQYAGQPNGLTWDWEDEDNYVKYRVFNDVNVGYIRCSSFDIKFSDAEIDFMLQGLQNTKGLIIDVRDNAGGDPTVAARLATHFTDVSVYTGYEQFKTGPGVDEFSEKLELTLDPASGVRYTKPIVVLMNRASFSATTVFLHHLRPLQHVTFMGDKSGGGGGSVADGILPNGWKYSLSVSQFYDYRDNHVEDGMNPDIAVSTNPADNIDAIIERAKEELK